MLDRSQLLKDLQSLLPKLEEDLRQRAKSPDLPEVQQKLQAEYQQAKAAKRTAQTEQQWQADYLTQIASAWVLSCVFVRFLEDNRLIEPPRIAGAGERLQRARDEHELYFQTHPTHTDRDYLLHLFTDLAQLPGAQEVFGETNPLWTLPTALSGDAAGQLLAFFQRIDANTGVLIHDFQMEADPHTAKPGQPQWDTRFLGDLYQDLSEAVRKNYALLQTPDFVESFILDRSLEPAIETFGPEVGLEGIRLIDPACGSGHFLLGAFQRIFERWQTLEPGTNPRVLAQRALDAVHGVDINPYAVAIARFRLLVAAMAACGVQRLKDAPDFRVRVACGDSLLHGEGVQLSLEKDGDWSVRQHHFATENQRDLMNILQPRYYHAVVANPPYIVPKDKALNEAYRKWYSHCYRQYSLAVPFMERIFELAVPGGFTGQITANSFMKREFGKKLIEGFFPRVNLTHVIDTSGAYIPGHGTPTVILLGRQQEPVERTIRTVMGIRGEPTTPENPAKGLVWSAILEQVDCAGSESEFVSVGDSPRQNFHKHPWSIGGGGAAELKEWLDKSGKETLGNVVKEIGFLAITGEDEVFTLPHAVFYRQSINNKILRDFVIGELIRDWGINSGQLCLFPYDNSGVPYLEISIVKYLWFFKSFLNSTLYFTKTKFERNMNWWEYVILLSNKLFPSLSIAFAFVATHNHFVLDRGGKVFKQSAPVIKLPPGATEDEHLALLGLLNSSTACFWMKQVFFPKGGDHVGSEGARIRKTWWDERFEFAGTGLQSFPIPKDFPKKLALKLDQLAQIQTEYNPINLFKNEANVKNIQLSDTHSKWINLLDLMISLQEELDWQCYKIYKLIDCDLTYPSEPPSLRLGERAFEIVLARKVAAQQLTTTWFERHNSTPITELPADWPEDYKQLVERRIELIETNKNIGLIEQPEYKRRWNVEPWESQLQKALESWLLDRLERYFDLDGRMNPEHQPTATITEPQLISTRVLADYARQDEEFLQVGELYRNDSAFNIQTLVNELVESESVPHLPILRYKPTGLRKRQDWEHTWALQRQEDAIDARTQLPKDHPQYLTDVQAGDLKRKEVGDIAVPPKYDSKDFQKTHYWKLRGKLDVPKERWISFPHCQGEDGNPLIAWAGYTPLQLALAISGYFINVQEVEGGSDDPRLVPLLASLLELLPWLRQWHNDPDPDYDGLQMGDYMTGFVEEEARKLDKTLEDIRTWEPPKQTSRRKRSG